MGHPRIENNFRLESYGSGEEVGHPPQPSLHRIAMNIAQLLQKLQVIPNVEIVVTLLPEMLRITGCPILNVALFATLGWGS
jgi:hypothetical protein